MRNYEPFVPSSELVELSKDERINGLFRKINSARFFAFGSFYIFLIGGRVQPLVD